MSNVKRLVSLEFEDRIAELESDLAELKARGEAVYSYALVVTTNHQKDELQTYTYWSAANVYQLAGTVFQTLFSIAAKKAEP